VLACMRPWMEMEVEVGLLDQGATPPHPTPPHPTPHTLLFQSAPLPYQPVAV
jgi:hypothetical protein